MMIPEEQQDGPCWLLCARPSSPEAGASTNVWRSIIQPQSGSSAARWVVATLTGDTLQNAARRRQRAKKQRTPARDPGATSTIYRKKRSTVEFTPVESAARPPGSAHAAAGTGRRATGPARPGGAQAIQPADHHRLYDAARFSRANTVGPSTQQFVSAYNAVRPPGQPQPAQPAAPQPRASVDTVPQPDTAAPAPAVDEPTHDGRQLSATPAMPWAIWWIP